MGGGDSLLYVVVAGIHSRTIRAMGVIVDIQTLNFRAGPKTWRNRRRRTTHDRSNFCNRFLPLSIMNVLMQRNL